MYEMDLKRHHQCFLLLFPLPGNRSMFEVSINEVASMESLGEVMQAGQVDDVFRVSYKIRKHIE